VRAIAKNFAGGANRIPQALDATYSSAAKSGAIHDEGIELHLAVSIQETAAARIEGLVVLHYDHSFFDRIERRSATFERSPSRGSRVANAVEVRIDHVIRNSPGTAVYDQNRIGWQIQTPREISAFSLAPVIAEFVLFAGG
jgi:hypothetical protein